MESSGVVPGIVRAHRHDRIVLGLGLDMDYSRLSFFSLLKFEAILLTIFSVARSSAYASLTLNHRYTQKGRQL